MFACIVCPILVTLPHCTQKGPNQNGPRYSRYSRVTRSSPTWCLPKLEDAAATSEVRYMMELRELLLRWNLPHSLSLHPTFYQTPLPILGLYTLFGTIIAYSIAKMFGFGSRNEFAVEGQVGKECPLIDTF